MTERTDFDRDSLPYWREHAPAYADALERGMTMNANEAFDAAEALNVVSLEWGLYAVNTRLHDDLRFRAGMGLDVAEGLDDGARERYEEYSALASVQDDPYSVPTWAEPILAAIAKADEPV
jgi:hypothetical protein